MKIVHGDICALAEQGMFDVIVQGCNCLHIMGAGLAKQMRLRWPEIHEVDLKTPCDFDKLGTISMAHISRRSVSFFVVNGYTQTRPGPFTDLIAIQDVFEAVQENFHGKRIGYPRIGAGLGGGDWTKISGIIEIALKGENHSLVEYQMEYR